MPLSRVLIAQDLESKEKSVLKVSKLSISGVLKREAAIHKSVVHENIISFKEFHESVEVDVSTKKSIKVAVLVTQLAENGELLGAIQRNGRLPEKIARTYFKQIIDTLAYLHKNNIAHRDIKPDNLLLDENYSIKVADFGFAEKFLSDQKSLKIVGTPSYFSPEMHEKVPHCPQSADLFAAGIILFAMVTGVDPFQTAEQKDPLYRLHIRREYDRFWNHYERFIQKQDAEFRFQKSFKDLLNQIWEYDVEKRYKLQDIQSHEWFVGETVNRETLKAFFAKNSTSSAFSTSM